MSPGAQPRLKPRSAHSRPEQPAEAKPGGKQAKPMLLARPGGVQGSKSKRFPIVGIGASAGGLEALEELFQKMPESTGMAFVVVTHQHPGHTSLLPSLLARVTKLPVLAVTDGIKVRPDHVYVAPPGGTLAIMNGVLQRMEMSKTDKCWLPIDCFFRSLAEDQKEFAVCIILSGTATDGTLGMRAIKGESGVAMAQQVQSAKYAGMPSSAISTGLVDIVAKPRNMPRHLMELVQRPLAALGTKETDFEHPLDKVFLLLRSRSGNDFSNYKPSTIRRRIQRRMQLNRTDTLEKYIRFLQNTPAEVDTLFRELLISVTKFFRDAEAFKLLEKKVLPHLLRGRSHNSSVRVWVPGCATGEEVYSLAILLRECAEKAEKAIDAQIFGTDLDSDAIAFARDGRYPDGIMVDVAPERLERYFSHVDHQYQVAKEIREMAVFAVQNVLKDPPFTKLDLISCRNLLIYVNADAQKQLFRLFHYALRPGGLLVLGPSETIGRFTELFDVVDKRWKIFRRKDVSLSTFPVLDIAGRRAPSGKLEPSPASEDQRRAGNVGGTVERLLASRFVPVAAVVNEHGEVVYIHGRAGAYLEPAVGQPRNNILDMAREGLQLELAAALRQAATARGREVIREGVRVKTNGGYTLVNIGVTKLHDQEGLRGLLLVTFHPQPRPGRGAARRKPVSKTVEASRVQELEKELRYTKESLQSTIEELETSNEELKSTNEELQSTNEEIETSKEEMHSLNEELSTVNNELETKLEELSRSNDDLQNLLNSTQIATIFLDLNLKIKRYTQQALNLFNLIQSDTGRPLADLVSKLDYGPLVADCGQVLKSLIPRQAEVRDKGGHWYFMRIMPYRTAENAIDGLVLTFVDIHPLKEAEKELRRMSKVFLSGLDSMIIMSLRGEILNLNDEAIRVFGWSRKEMIGQPLEKIIAEPERTEFTKAVERCRAGETVRNAECLRVTKADRELRGLLSLFLLTDENERPDALAVVTKIINH